MATNINKRSDKAKLTVVPTASGQTSTKDNQHKDTQAIWDAEAMQLRSIMNQYREADSAVLLIKAQLKEAQDAKTQIFHSGKAAIPALSRKKMESYLADMTASKRDLIREEQIRRRHHEMLGIITGEQMELFSDSSPAEVKDEAHWRGEGYAAGSRLEPAVLPQGLPPRFNQAYLEEHGKATKIMTDAINAQTAAKQAVIDADLAKSMQGEPTPEPEDEEEAIKKKARKLKASGFMDTSKEDAESF